MTVKWKLTDLGTDEFVFLPYNPNTMSRPSTPRNMSYAWGVKTGLDRIRAIDTAPDAATQWTFGGVILTQDHDDLLRAWTARRAMLQVDDHVGNSYRVMLQRYDPVERLPSKTKPFRADYTITALLLGAI